MDDRDSNAPPPEWGSDSDKINTGEEEQQEEEPPPGQQLEDEDGEEEALPPPLLINNTSTADEEPEPPPIMGPPREKPTTKSSIPATVSASEGSELPFCSIDFWPEKKIHTAYADGEWYLEDDQAGATCLPVDNQYTKCTPPASWKVNVASFTPFYKPGTAREKAGWIGCPNIRDRECSAKGVSEETRVLEAMRWQWRPKGCRLHEFTPAAFLKLIGKNNVYMIGDSLTADQGESLQCVLPPEAGLQISIQRRDYLGATGAPMAKESQALMHALTGPKKEEQRKILVAHLIKRWKDVFGEDGRRPNAPEDTEHDILQFNAGAHWTLDPSGAMPVFRAVAAAIKASFRGLVLFRTNVMGHNECHKFTDPFKTAVEAKATATRYNWMDFRAYNAAIYEAFKLEGVQHFRVVDVSMFERRGDGHVTWGDCLHYCKPGNPDFWNKKVLFHILQEYYLHTKKT